MEDALANIIVAITCLSGPLFFISTITLGFVLFKQRNKYLHEKDVAQNEQKSLIEKQLWLEFKISDLNHDICTLSTKAFEEFRLKWFKEITLSNYGSELEVEIKFIYLLLRFLGFENDDICTRVSIEVPVGRQKITGIADWVIYNHEKKPYVVIEAKGPGQQINRDVQEQARSYAFALKAPFYLLTNGKELAVYERKVEDDICKLALNLEEIEGEWRSLFSIIGKKSQESDLSSD